MQKETKAEVLRRTIGVDAYPTHELKRLSKTFRNAYFEAGEVLMVEGGEGNGAYLIADGRARVTIDGQLVAELGPGEFVGEMALLEDAPRSATVTALTPMRALSVDRARFRRLVAERPIMEKMTMGLARRVRRGPVGARNDGAPGTSRTPPSPVADGSETLRTALDAARAARRRRHRWRITGFVAASLVLLLVGGVTIRVLADRSSPIPLDEAVARYRGAAGAMRTQPGGDGPGTPHQAGGAPRDPGAQKATEQVAPADPRPVADPPAGVVQPSGSQRAAPEPGVYVYATSGYEEISVLGGSRHTYPDRTTITVTPNDCGVTLRWDALEERWDRLSTCVWGRAIAVRQFVTFHEFFEKTETVRFACVDTFLRPRAEEPGTTLRGRCEAEDTITEQDVEAVGTETLTISGQDVPAVRVLTRQTITGATRGTRVFEAWYAIDTGLQLRSMWTTDVDTKSPFGPAHYYEEVELQAESLDPKR